MNVDNTEKQPFEDAAELVYGARQDDYGHQLDNFGKIAMIWTALLMDKLIPGEVIEASDIALMMTGVKLAREQNKHLRDNVVDAHGYLMTYQLVLEEKRKRVSENHPSNMTQGSNFHPWY
jgi:hypothetical protein